MKYLKAFALLVALISGSAAWAGDSFDLYNTYLWDRTDASDRGDWFEWWYYKVVDPTTNRAFFFTYGVINPWDTSGTVATNSAVLQVGDFEHHFMISQRFPMSEFTASREQTSVRVADNTATDSHIQGHMVDPKGHEVSWDIAIQKVWGFNAMGWTMAVPDISGIYWYPAQAAATMTGWLRSDGQTTYFKDAPAYQDRNWGRSFPKWWTWLTANGFKDSPDTVLAAGGGEPKILNWIYIKGGLGIGLRHQGVEYIFRSSDLDKFDFNIHWGQWNVIAENGRGQRIEIVASAPEENFIDIPFYSPQGDQFHDYEALLGHMTVKLYRWDLLSWSWQSVATLETDAAGVEWGSPSPVGAMGTQNISKLFNTAGPLR